MAKRYLLKIDNGLVGCKRTIDITQDVEDFLGSCDDDAPLESWELDNIAQDRLWDALTYWVDIEED